MKAIENKKDLDDWGKQGNATPAPPEFVQTSEESKSKNTIKSKVKAAAKKWDCYKSDYTFQLTVNHLWRTWDSFNYQANFPSLDK